MSLPEGMLEINAPLTEEEKREQKRRLVASCQSAGFSTAFY